MEDKCKKNIAKSIRITENTYDFVNKQDGKGFNEKLENMIIFYESKEKKYTKIIEDLENKKLLLLKDIAQFLDLRKKLQIVNMQLDSLLQSTKLE